MKTLVETVRRWTRDIKRERLFIAETVRQFYRGSCWIGYFAPTLPPRMVIDQNTALVCNLAHFSPHRYPVPVWYFLFDHFAQVEIGLKWIAWPRTRRARRALWRALNTYLDLVVALSDLRHGFIPTQQHP